LITGFWVIGEGDFNAETQTLAEMRREDSALRVAPPVYDGAMKQGGDSKIGSAKRHDPCDSGSRR
jgi:hypothetical protein